MNMQLGMQLVWIDRSDFDLYMCDNNYNPLLAYP